MAFQPRGDMPYAGTYTKEKKKAVLLFYLPTLRQWILDTGSLTNSECTFKKKKSKSTQGYLVFGLPVRGGHAIYLPKYKWEESVFSDNQFTNSDTMG